jgi:RHS repeat-associated protein
VSETAGTATYSYNANGQETGLTHQNGTTVSKVYDDAGRLTSVTNRNSSNTVLSSFAYTLNNDDMRTYVVEADNSTVTYSYNGIGRLTGETRTGTNAFTASYTLDGEGNRTSQTIGANTTSFTLNDDYELTATSGGFANSYSYNANGEQTGRTLNGAAHTLGYDYEGQLTQITQGQNTTDPRQRHPGAGPVYDALGCRYSRTAGGTTTVFYYAGNQVLLEKQGDTFTAAYTHGNALLRRNSEYPLYDGHGSERTVTNGSETVTGTINFEAFGQTAGSTGSSSSPYMYAGAWGYRTDGDAGLMHVGARYYDAQVGRFITRDTVLSEHPYLYCEHDPVNAVDPSGHRSRRWFEWCKEIGSAVMAVGAISIGAGKALFMASGGAGTPVSAGLATGGALIAAVGGALYVVGFIGEMIDGRPVNRPPQIRSTHVPSSWVPPGCGTPPTWDGGPAETAYMGPGTAVDPFSGRRY